MYYAYYLEDENISDIVDNWDKCQTLVKGKKSRYKKFNSLKEAKEWLSQGAMYTPKIKKTDILHKDAIYFDSGTGRGKTVEVKLADVHGDSLLPFILPSEKINAFGNYFLSEKRTNNFGELTGIFFALKYAKKFGIKKICGDSKLIIEYWSKGIHNLSDQDTINLIDKVKKAREEFEEDGGEIIYISGNINPADLGFHK